MFFNAFSLLSIFFNDFETTYYWSSSELAEDEFANYLWLWNDGNIDILSGVKSNGIHVRCIKDK